MTTQDIPLDQLQSHPANSNVMPDHLLAKLVRHIEDTDRYPPLIVRPLPPNGSPSFDPSATTTQYQILDGHHRVAALKQLGRDHAQCVIWQVDDREALLLLATLNRLQGQDDPTRRASLIGSLAHRYNTKQLADLLPERVGQVKKLMELNATQPKPRDPTPIADMPVAVHFFLRPDQKRRLIRCLSKIGGPREQALMLLIDQHDES